MITKCTKWAVRVAPDCKFGSHQGGGGDHCRAAAAAFGCFSCFCCSFNSSNFPTQQGSPQNADFSVPVEGSGDSKVRFLGETFSSFSSSVDRTVPESSNHPPATSSRQRGEREGCRRCEGVSSPFTVGCCEHRRHERRRRRRREDEQISSSGAHCMRQKSKR